MHENDVARRHETPDQRADRNWLELLQELRVSQTGVQLLAGFLVTLPFQARFDELDAFQRGWYLALLLVSVLTVGVTLAPVAIHRRLFQGAAKPELVRAAHRFMRVVLVLIPVLLTGIVFLVVDVVAGRTSSVVCAAGTAVVMVLLLVLVPHAAANRVRSSRR